MDVNDSFYQNYFTNQSGSVNSWTPSVEGQDSKENDFDYHSLIESFNSKNTLEVPLGSRSHSVGEGQNQSTTRSLTGISWSDFGGGYLSKSLNKQSSNTGLTSSQSEFFQQLKSEWESKPSSNNPVDNSQNVQNSLNIGAKTPNINSMLSKILEEGYETRLSSSRASEKSTNRTSIPSGVCQGHGNLNNSLVGNSGYNLMSEHGMLNNNLLNSQLLNSGINLGNVNSLGNNLNAQLLRNQLINNQLLNRRILNNQLLNSHMLANANVFGNPNLGRGFRSMGYNSDYMSGDFLGASDFITNNFNVDPSRIPMNLYDYHPFGYNKFCKPLKYFKNRPTRKKRNNKADLFPLPSLKDAEFEKAVNYLKQTLVSLYKDQIMPIYFNVRGRFIEFNTEEIPPEHIMDLCKRKPDIFNVVSNGSLNETFIYLVEEPSWFVKWVDRNDLRDIYPAEMWDQFFQFIKNYKDEHGNEYFPGSIYGMSRTMQEHNLPFLEGMSLGTICHIIQLAIRLKKYLVYDMKTLKPSESVRSGQFIPIPEAVEENAELRQEQIVEDLKQALESQNPLVIGDEE
ncbi:OST-HTH Associated domain protein [Theileria parva strain Muguga]|uniref:OST-HTH Associated domain protein n=1 Tax=Theileria parva strain Muguga TaxID=333668 RepID=UPI001C61700C|nr:OST-HTH Associated domain protein [Theileria parva strain Muguga]EAN31836.2 OST-HTH Associated domain protein [Theileria parva strain Muguga]